MPDITCNSKFFMRCSKDIYFTNTLRSIEDCQFEPWSDWTACSITCGGEGVQTRSRGQIPAVGNGKECVGPEIETRSCSSAPCEGACITTDWTDFTPCSKSCGVGSQTRTRSFTSQQPNCTDQLIEVRDCNVECCPGNALLRIFFVL